MFVGPTFPGDDNRELMLLQHDLWFKSNGAWMELNGLAMGGCLYIFWIARSAYLFNTTENPLFFPERETLASTQSFDHRVLQYAHHKMASFYRWISVGQKQPAFAANAENRKAYLLANWKTYLTHEVANLTFGNIPFAEYIVKAVAFANTERGYKAEDSISAILDKRYGEHFTDICAAYSKERDPSDDSQGYIYILVNPALRSDFLKIGKTTRTPSQRAEEISLGTGVPLRFYVAYEVLVSDCHACERVVHERLNAHRSATNREFFELPLNDAIHAISEIAASFAPNPGVLPAPASGRG